MFIDINAHLVACGGCLFLMRARGEGWGVLLAVGWLLEVGTVFDMEVNL